ncbi:MAG TPA: GNAT family N-acetyltransferase [Polyangia bacterium]|nr:GNAT family N-acetyltransferase [Polyangia bacterium]
MVRIRSLEATDIAGADEVLREAFHTEHSFAPRLHRYLAIQPDGWLVAQEAGEFVGMVGAIDYGSFAYVGMMGVRPDRQGHGVGRRLLGTLLDWLEGRGVPCARLEATEQGRHLYQRMGFVDAGVCHELHLPASATAAPRPPSVEVAAAPGQVVSLDAHFFGTERPRLWKWLFAAEPGRTLVAREGADPAGYLCVQEDVLGPWGARTPAVAEALLEAALPFVRSPHTRAMVPEQNEGACALLEARGWTLAKSVPHMRRGPGAAPPGWRALYGKGSYCLG